LPAAVLILVLLAVMADLLPLVVSGTLFERDSGRLAITVAGLGRGPSDSSH
jgi:hypothetical protein